MLLNDIKFEQFGTALKLKYNKGKDSILIENYYSDEEMYGDFEAAITIVDKNGEELSLNGDDVDLYDVILTNNSPVYTFSKKDFKDKEIEITEDNKLCKKITITSVGNNTKTIDFSKSGFSFGNNGVRVEYEPLYENPDYPDYVTGISTSLPVVVEDDKEHLIYKVSYNDYLSGDNNNLIITDSDGSYDVLSYVNPANSINWSTNNDNHIAYVQGNEGNIVVTSGTGSNIIQTNGGISMTYTYGGGKDTVGAQANMTDDTYNVEFTYDDEHGTGTALNIYDKGGDDTLNLVNTSIDDVRLVFNYDLENGIESDILMIHSDAFNPETIISASCNHWTPGVICVQAHTDADGFGIETVNTTDVENVDTSTWAMAIATEVAGWLEANNCGSVAEAFETEKADADLFACFMSYSDALNYN